MKKPKNVKICLNAMVGNEEATITRMLKSVVGYVDYYVIQCNGKIDNTKQIIDDFFAQNGVPGFTYEIDWDYPGWNRDHTLQTALKADHGCDWILRMDADEQLSVDDNFDWSPFNDTMIDSFNIVADPGDAMYYRTWMWNAHRPWFFAHDKRHETIHLPVIGEGFNRVNLETGFRQVITNDGETWFAPMKFLKDALELESDKVPSNKVLEDDYHLWYIGKSYSDSYGNPDEFPFGIDHAREYARRCIFYFNMYLNKLHNYSQTQQPANIDDMGYYAMFLIGNAYKFMGKYDMALETYEKALEFNPARNEAMMAQTELLEQLGRHEEMMKLSFKMLKDGKRKNPFPAYTFLIHNSAYYNTSAHPFWLHIKSLRYLGKSYDHEIEWMKRVHDQIPQYIIDDLEGTTPPVIQSTPEKSVDFVLSNGETTPNPITLTGVFGISR